jgi:hypothetical protein
LLKKAAQKLFSTGPVALKFARFIATIAIFVLKSRYLLAQVASALSVRQSNNKLTV